MKVYYEDLTKVRNAQGSEWWESSIEVLDSNAEEVKEVFFNHRVNAMFVLWNDCSDQTVIPNHRVYRVTLEDGEVF